MIVFVRIITVIGLVLIWIFLSLEEDMDIMTGCYKKLYLDLEAIDVESVLPVRTSSLPYWNVMPETL